MQYHLMNKYPDFIRPAQTLKCGDRDIVILESTDLVEYPDAIAFMEDYIALIQKNEAPEAIWFLEHPDIYTAGTSAQKSDLLSENRFPVYETGRGGQYTYHGPGQLIGYMMFNIAERGIGVREFVKKIEHMIIEALSFYDLKAVIREGRVGVWLPVDQTLSGTEDKIAAIGIRIRRGVSFHGFSVNLAPNLLNYTGIVPCGLSNYGVTSLKRCGKNPEKKVFLNNICKVLESIF